MIIMMLVDDDNDDIIDDDWFYRMVFHIHPGGNLFGAFFIEFPGRPNLCCTVHKLFHSYMFIEIQKS